jgi:DNA modification methylase
MKLINADCIQAMREMAENSVDSIVTDPPYELGFMGKKWDSSGIAFNVEVWQQALRVLKPGGHLLAFSGSRTYHRMVVAIEDAGFEIRDQIMWIYGSGFPKSHDVSKGIDKAAGAQREVVGSRTVQDIRGNRYNSATENMKYDITAPATLAAIQWQGWGTALKPAHEPIVVARKPLIGTVAENVLEHGVGGLNIDGCRIASNLDEFFSAKGKPRSGKGHAHGYGMGEGFGGDAANAPHTAGRWPANIIFDEQAAELLDEQSGLSKSNVGLRGSLSSDGSHEGWKREAHADFNGLRGHADSGGASRFFYCAKASKRDRNEGLKDLEDFQSLFASGSNLHKNGDGTPRNKKATSKNFHPTVKPTSLMRYLVRLVTPPKGLVLDPFMGSGSTGKACALEHFDFVGIELNAEYIKICEARIENALQDKEQQQELF